MSHCKSSATAAALAALLPLLTLLPGTVSGGGQECYVCLPGDEAGEELQRQFPGEELPLCAAPPERPPVKNCPPQYRGCLTQYNGEKVTRSCGELNITTCQMANGIYYCYCKEPLCNGPESDRTPPHKSDPGSSSEENKGGGGRGGGGLPDDEDMVPAEGSGGGHAREESRTSSTIQQPQQPRPSVQPRAASAASSSLVYMSPVILAAILSSYLAN